MRLRELLLNGIMNTRLFEMAFDRQTAKNKVTSLSPLIFDHLLKLWVLNSPQTANHWYSEIDSWLNQIDNIYLKSSKKKPSKQDLYNWLIFDSAPHYSEEYMNHVITKWKRKEYATVPLRDFDTDVVLNQILSVIDKICMDISNNNFTTIDDYLK